jgi:hypothetical protein
VTDSRVYRLTQRIRDELAFHAQCDPPDAEAAERLMKAIAEVERDLRADDALMLRTLVKRLSGIGND